MLRPFTIAALAAITLLMTAPRVGAGILPPIIEAGKQWKQVVAKGGSGGDVYATAYHGFFQGNDATGQLGTPLYDYLNFGTQSEVLTLVPDGQRFTISDKGMFGSIDRPGLTLPQDPQVSNVIDTVSNQTGFGGFNHSTDLWTLVGKSDEQDGAKRGPFTNNGQGGKLTLSPGLTEGAYVLSLKGGDLYEVFLFTSLRDITSFEYVIGGTSNLSHASLYRVGPGGEVTPDGSLPEPASLAVFGFGALLGVGGLVRRRFPNRKGFALRGLAT